MRKLVEIGHLGIPPNHPERESDASSYCVLPQLNTDGKALMAMFVMISLKKGIIGAKLLKIGDRYVGGHSVFSM